VALVDARIFLASYLASLASSATILRTDFIRSEVLDSERASGRVDVFFDAVLTNFITSCKSLANPMFSLND
jgi:hypothetical protein